MRSVTICAIAQRSRMLHLCLIDLLRLLGMAGNAELLWAGCRQHDLAVFHRLMTCAAGGRAAIKGCMHHGLHQLGAVRLMRVVALETISLRKRLVIVSLLQAGIVPLMTFKTECRSRFLEVIRELSLIWITNLVNCVTGVAAHIQSCVPAAFGSNFETRRVAAQAEILLFVS